MRRKRDSRVRASLNTIVPGRGAVSSRRVRDSAVPKINNLKGSTADEWSKLMYHRVERNIH